MTKSRKRSRKNPRREGKVPPMAAPPTPEQRVEDEHPWKADWTPERQWGGGLAWPGA